MSTRDVHIIGAGLAGLNAAVTLADAGHCVTLYEASGRAGGRCRSYHDPQLGMVIDNGNHFVFSGNRAVYDFLGRIGAVAGLHGPERAEFAFHDLRDDQRWTLRVNDGAVPWWVLNRTARTPGTKLSDYFALVRMMLAGQNACIGDIVPQTGAFWERVVEPMMLAVLNCPPAVGSARLAGRFLAESFARGGSACRTMVALPTLDAVFVDPARAYLAAHGGHIAFNRRLRRIEFGAHYVKSLDFGDGPEPINDARVILAVPPWIAGEIVPDLVVPDQFSSILNAHFALPPPEGSPMITALVGATAQWVVCHSDRISVTISGADSLIDEVRETLAAHLWAEVCATLGIVAPLPVWQIVKEKRATYMATPDQERRRPETQTRWHNLFLAGDWTKTGLPATIEGALRSGASAARAIREE